MLYALPQDSRSCEPILRVHDLYSFSKLLLCYKPEGALLDPVRSTLYISYE